MIHNEDTHWWLGSTPEGLISMEDYNSSDEMFRKVEKLRMEPLSPLSYQVIFEVTKPEGYSLFWRHRIKQDMLTNHVEGLEYVIAIELGQWSVMQAASIDITDLKHLDGFTATLQFDGSVDLDGVGWTHEMDNENGIPIYRFIRI
jgi:hypothetical protein